MKATGSVFKYGDNVDTDVIIPARYLNITDGYELAKHCMEDIDRDFVKNVKKGDIIVANKNFGCGSSREHAPLVIKCAGVSCVIAETFARIFSNARRLLRPSLRVTRWKSILTAVSLRIRRRDSPMRARHSRRLCRRLFLQGD